MSLRDATIPGSSGTPPAGARRKPHLVGVLVHGRVDESDALAIAERAQPEAGVDAKVERGVVDDADQRHTSMVEGEHRPEGRDAMNEFFGPVDWIDDPLKRAVRPRGWILLADDAVIGEPAVDQLARATLDGLVDLGDEGRVRLCLHGEPAFERRRDDPARLVGQLDRRGVVALDVGGRGHHAASYTSTPPPRRARAG